MTARWEIVLAVVRLALIATVTPGRVRPSTVTTLCSVTPPLGARTFAVTTDVAVGFTALDRRTECVARGVGVAATRTLVDVNTFGAIVAVAMGRDVAITVGVVESVGVAVLVLVLVGDGVAVLVLVLVGVAVLVLVFVGVAVLVLVLVGTGDGVAVSVGAEVAVAVLVAVGTASAPGVLLGDGVVFGRDVAVATGMPPAPVQSAARLARLGEPQPVTSSHPVPVGWPLLPLVTSWKSRAAVVALVANW